MTVKLPTFGPPQPHAVRRSTARDAGDGVRRPRPGLALSRAPAGAASRQHEDAVETIFVGKQRLYNRRFLQMCSDYLVDPVACTPASGWEKKPVENQVGLIRDVLHAPAAVQNLRRDQRWLTDRCIAYAKAHRHPELTTRRSARCLRRSGRSSFPIPAGSTASMQCRRRSRRPAWCASTATVLGDSQRSGASGRGSCLCRPHRDRQNGRMVASTPAVGPWRYSLPPMALRAGARPQAWRLRNGAPFKDSVSPAAMERVRRKLAGADDGNGRWSTSSPRCSPTG